MQKELVSVDMLWAAGNILAKFLVIISQDRFLRIIMADTLERIKEVEL